MADHVLLLTSLETHIGVLLRTRVIKEVREYGAAVGRKQDKLSLGGITHERPDRKAISLSPAAEQLLTIGADPKHRGARIGITAVLHIRLGNDALW